jgi:hypothetical protein
MSARLIQDPEVEPQVGIVPLGAIAGDAVGMFGSFSCSWDRPEIPSPALAPKRIIPADAMVKVLTLR